MKLKWLVLAFNRWLGLKRSSECRPVMVPPEIATRRSWKTLEPPRRFTEIQYRDRFTQAEYETIKAGLVPQEMENKWFIFYEHPTLWLYRSWTGELIYRVTFQSDDVGAHVIFAEMSAKYERESMHEKDLPWVIRYVLLGQNVEFPEL